MAEEQKPPLTMKDTALKLALQSPMVALLGFAIWVFWQLTTPLADALPKCIGNLPV